MRLWVGVCAMLLAVNVQAADGKFRLDWLKTVAFAAHQTDYSGVFIYQYGSHVETSRIAHITEADSEYEKLESLDGPKREIIRHHGQVWCYSNHKMVQVMSQPGKGRFPALLPDQLSNLGENYQVQDAGVERVAGYPAQVILFQPKDNFRYIHKIWVHTDSGLLLKSVVLNDKNQVVEQYSFTQLKIGPEADRSWLTSNEAMAATTTGTGKPVVAAGGQANTVKSINSGWVVDAMPSGFKKTMEILRPMHGKHAPVIQLVFSDGLSAISIFIEPADSDEDDNDGLSSRGAVNLYHKVVNKTLFNVVGEVPPLTVMQVLDSVRYNGK
ncbi:MAG: MucB/RseB C-terminal domain-containing protein [Gallionella sp.]|nr:MucB/RseB C-terminal domain-containing protein [Gallionella sp.]MDD4947657.1 MucB/RseB C-terminal domain-containing protein [Gallionella sp.]